jgi:glycerol-3-phosphate dehydrogenase
MVRTTWRASASIPIEISLRGMAEHCANVVCRKLGVDAPCRTRDTILLPHSAFYAA